MTPLQDKSVTELLHLWREGREDALEKLLTLVHDDLRRIARGRLRALPSGHLLQPTALVNEAFLRLVDASQVDWQDRAHFFAIASRLMRQIAVDEVRSGSREKRGGGWQRVELEDAGLVTEPDILIVAVDEALNRLTALDARKARVVEMRYFGGMDNPQIAHALHVSIDTVKRDWAHAKLWLARELAPRETPPRESQ